MIVEHTEFIHARCPVEPAVFDYYKVVFSTSEVVPVEKVRSALRRHAGRTVFQESLTQALATETGCWVQTSGLHHTTRTKVACVP